MNVINLICISSLRSDLLIRKIFTVNAYNHSDTNEDHKYDIVVVGGGIIGTAVSRELAIRYPKLKLAIVEKENKLACHQTGHNSGVIHAGIYYKPGTLKAKLCVEGSKLAYNYCDQKKIPYKKIGKLIVAVDSEEIPRLDELYNRGIQNGVKDLKFVDKHQIKEFEPNCVGLKAIWSPNTGIVDWNRVCHSFGDDFKSMGGRIYFNFEANKFEYDNHSTDYPVKLFDKNTNIVINARFIVTAAGIQSDKIAKLTGGKANPKIVPFRGEYLIMKPEKCHLVRSNIYPVPDPRFPFLGVHFTPRMDGSVWLGPNAVLAFKREGYRKSDFSISDTWETISYKGFRKLAYKYYRKGFDELYRSYRVKEQVKLLQKYVPILDVSDIEPDVYKAGIRAQALDENGDLVDDFVFDSGKDLLGERILHVRNAPSPAATSSLAIAQMIANEVDQRFFKK